MKTVWHRFRLRFLGLPIVAALAFFFVPLTGRAFDFAQRSVSKSGQFIVYCSDVRLRIAVTDYAETAKHDVLETLAQTDHWKLPVVIDLRRAATTDTQQPLRQVRMTETEGGWRVEIDVLLRDGEMKQVRFPQLITQAILLELAYRDHPPEVGTTCIQPPAWLVEGLAQTMVVRATGATPNAALFRQLIDTGRLPKIADFLKSNVEAMDATSLAVHDSCAASLLGMLTSTPEGRLALAKMVKGLRDSDGDPVAMLIKYFPALGGSETALEKWWTLGLAHSAAVDAQFALNVTETDARLTALLKLELVADPKTQEKKEFALTDYKTFLKLPGAKQALVAQFNGLNALLAQAHPLLRPVVQEYARILNSLAKDKKHGMDDALGAVANYRELIVARMDKIDDYLNWYEATQMPEKSGVFDDFLKSAKAAENWTPPKRNDAISRYIDQLQREFQ